MKKGMMIVSIIGMLMVMPTVVNASNDVISSTNGSMVGASVQQVKAVKQTPKVEIIKPVVEQVVTPVVEPVEQQTTEPITSNTYECPYGNIACNQNGACLNNGQCQNSGGNYHYENGRHDGMGHRGGGQGYHNGNHHN